MQPAKQLWRKLRHLAASRAYEREMAEEIRFHVESRAEELEAGGMSARAARLQAEREFGRQAKVREEAREAWRVAWLADLVSDLRYAIRGFGKSPGFVLTAVLSLALGIGANTAIFSLATSFMMNRPSVRDASTLGRFRVGGASHIPYPLFEFVRNQQPFADMAGVAEEGMVNWNSGTETRRINAFRVSGNFFDMVGVPVERGRGLRPGEDLAAVLSYHFWQNQMQGNPDVVGRTLILDAKPYQIVGVLPRDHRTVSGFGLSPDLYLPVDKQAGMLAIIGRLPQGMTSAEALSRLRVAASELQRVYPNEHSSWAENLRYFPVEGLESFGAIGPAVPVKMFFALLGAVVVLVLLIACANVSGLLLARMAARRQEIAVQLSLGAPRNRILRQCFAESLLLAGLGTASGLVVNRLLVSLVAQVELPLPFRIRLVAEADDRLAFYAAGVALLCAVLVGIAPALHAMRENVLDGLKLTERSAGGRQRLRRVLVMGQMAVCALLLATGFVFLRNMQEAAHLDVGFDTRNTLWANVRVLDSRYPTNEARAAFASQTIRDLERLPGIERASVANWIPLTDGRFRRTPLRTAHAEEPQTLQFHWMAVGPGYFETMRIPLRQGREFNEFDREGSPKAVILNETMARRLFGAANAVGQELRFRDNSSATVVGVVADSKYSGLAETGENALYDAWLQTPHPGQGTEFVVRGNGVSASLLLAVRDLFLRNDSSAAVEVKPVQQALGFAMLPSQGGAVLLGGLGVLSLLLASVGLAGMIAYAMHNRTREIGLRVAMGASPAAVFRLVAREASWITGIGLALGLGAAWFAVQPLSAFLVPGLEPADPLAFIGVAIALAFVSLLATLGPARRALGLEPLRALREE